MSMQKIITPSQLSNITMPLMNYRNNHREQVILPSQQLLESRDWAHNQRLLRRTRDYPSRDRGRVHG
jgi:hypothetical protein